MVYQGHVENGRIILDEEVNLPNGASVEVKLVNGKESPLPRTETLSQKLLKHAGTVTGLPSDAARNHDHYLYGTPKD